MNHKLLLFLLLALAKPVFSQDYMNEIPSNGEALMEWSE
jgi:hypothetical protein